MGINFTYFFKKFLSCLFKFCVVLFFCGFGPSKVLAQDGSPSLSFTSESMSYTMVQGGANPATQTATLSASDSGTPTATLSVSYTSGSDWLVVPTTINTGSLSIDVNAASLTQGTYTATITASASGYTDAITHVTLIVTAPVLTNTLTFSPASLSYTVARGSGNPNSQSSILSASDNGNPAVALSVSYTTPGNWLVMPTANFGSLSFGINASGLTEGTYTATVAADASGYATAKLQVTLTVTAPAPTPVLSFSPSPLSFSVVAAGANPPGQTSTLSVSDNSTPVVNLSVSYKSGNSWVVLPTGAVGYLSFGVNASGLAPGTYSATVTASASSYTSATLTINLTVTAPPALSFSTTSLSYSVVENGTTANKTSTLSSNSGTPTVTLAKSASWVVIPTAALGSLSFEVNAAGLAPGTYSSTVTASASGYTSATLTINLTVTAPPALSFSTTSLSYSVVQNGTTANKTSTLSSNSGTPTVTLAKSASWVVLPTAALGSLSFGINAAGLAPGTYSATVTASANGYTSATLTINLTVTVPKALSFSTTSLTYSVVQNGTTANKTSTLSSNSGTPTVTLAKSASWVVLPTAALGSLSFGINASGLAPGTYSATVTASASGYSSATLKINLTVTAPPALSFSTASLSYLVVQNGTTANKTSTLSSNSGTTTVTLAKSASWVVIPTAALGSLSFGINSSGLAPGTYSATVTASASGYTSATLTINLTVTVPKALSFSTTSLSYSVVQNGTTANKTSTLSSNSGTPTVTLAKSASWVVLPTAALGSLSFGINASGLAPGTYSATVTASASGYTSATLTINLTVTVPKALSFSTTSLSYSVVQNGTTANKTSTLSSNSGAPTVTLAKSASWVALPTEALGSLSFGINASGLAPGTYSATVTASASGYTSATLTINLTVTVPKALSFSTTSLSYSVVQNGTTANKTSTLSSNSGTPTVTLAKSASWVVLPTAALGSLSFGINASGLAPGTYSAKVTASASGYTSAVCNISLTVTPAASVALNIKVNFQDSATVPPSGWIRDFGQPYGLRTLPNQGSGIYYGWINKSDNTPLNLTKNGRKRTGPADILLATLMHVQANNLTTFTGTKIEGRWMARIANGKYDVTVSVGDDTQIDSKHTINVEGVSVISGFVPTSAQKFKTASATVSVSDGYLTIDAIGGTNTKINSVTIRPAAPSVVSVNPTNGAVNVSENTSISTNILKLPNSGINNNTITTSSVYLTENSTGALVSSHVNGTGGGDAITLVPASPLKLNTTYKFHITSGVKDLSGVSFVPYSSTFTTTSTATPVISTIKFDKVSLPTATGMHSSITIGPDGKLYALTIDGIIKRFPINADGTLGTPQLIYSLQDAYGTRKQRLAVGFAFDPAATATNLIVWITHSYYAFVNSPDWAGKLTKLSGSNLQTVQDVLINLPRSAKDHVTSSIAFGPDHALYFTQGSTSAMGRADQTWGNRSEHLLSAAVLRLDISKLGTLPLNVKTADGGGTYNPYNTNAPLTIYASGIRNAYDLVWHSNGSLYTPANGSAAGGNTPASVPGTLRPNGTTYSGPLIAALTNVQQTQKDFLFRIVKGGYYGHPNPTRGEYVMNGGNPTSGTDKAEVTSYPVGTLPDANWKGYSFDFQNNVSPNGAIEYKSSVFNGALKGKLLVVRYSQHDDIIALTPGTSKDIVSSIAGTAIAGFSGFVDPLDITENVKNGNLYVSEYGGNKITLLRPHTGTATAAKTVSDGPIDKHNYNTNPSCDDTTDYAFPAKEAQLAMPVSADNERSKVSPNPLHKRFVVDFPKAYEGEVTLQIIDPLGKVYELGKSKLKAGGSEVPFDISKFSLKSGIYFLKIYSDTKTETIKLLVQ